MKKTLIVICLALSLFSSCSKGPNIEGRPAADWVRQIYDADSTTAHRAIEALRKLDQPPVSIVRAVRKIAESDEDEFIRVLSAALVLQWKTDYTPMAGLAEQAGTMIVLSADASDVYHAQKVLIAMKREDRRPGLTKIKFWVEGGEPSLNLSLLNYGQAASALSKLGDEGVAILRDAKPNDEGGRLTFDEYKKHQK
jgi:hypothetical protein